ncbi:MAG: MFS transporter [Candidatus Bathyarchaeota archaeon]|nr:MFS transporter [Candidatus Bathyarchaeota archaeon]
MNYKWTVLTVTTIGVLMAGIDSRILIVGLPQVAAALHADAEQAIWLTQAYTLGSTVVLLLVGRVSDMFGRVKIYIAGFALFTLGSALISVSSGPAEVIAFRVLQGVGSGILNTNSVAMIVDATPIKELGFSLGLNMSSFRFGAMAGLTLSGVLLAIFDWRALFWVNVPVGIFGTLWAWKRLKEVGKIEKNEPFDLIGLLTFTVTLTSFLLAMTFQAYGLAEVNTVYILLLVCVVSLAAFVGYERRIEHPILDLRLLGIREFTGGVVAQLLNAAAWGAVLLLLSLYLQIVLGLSPFEAGIRLIPFEIVGLVVGLASGKLSDKYGPFFFTTSGLVVTSLSLYLFSTVGIDTPFVYVLAYTLLFGIGTGLFGSPNMSSIMGSVPPERRGIASAFRSIMFSIGFTISMNLAILLMATVIPYGLLSEIITEHVAGLTDANRLLFLGAMKTTYLWLAGINALALIPSILRGNRVASKPLSPADAALE